jgi:hypothetical protein
MIIEKINESIKTTRALAHANQPDEIYFVGKKKYPTQMKDQ